MKLTNAKIIAASARSKYDRNRVLKRVKDCFGMIDKLNADGCGWDTTEALLIARHNLSKLHAALSDFYQLELRRKGHDAIALISDGATASPEQTAQVARTARNK